MTLLDLLNSVWAILPEKLLQIEKVIMSHMSGDKLDLKKIEARLMSFDNSKPDAPYQIINGSAIIPINGVLSNNPSAFERIFFDAVSMEKIRADVSAAVSDPSVNQVVLSIDSPGGTMAGTQETANHIFNIRGSKPIIAHSSGMIASAAYYIGAAADKILLSGDNVMAGSIGTIYRHIDRSKQNENDGVKITEVVSGKLKNAFSENVPLNQERIDFIQSIVNQSLETFANDLGKFRGLKQENMGDGKVFLGKEAVDAGIADGFALLEAILNGSVAGVRSTDTSKISAQSDVVISAEGWTIPLGPANLTKENSKMTYEEFKKNHPELFEQAVSEGKVDLEAQVKTAYDKGKSDELSRVNGIKAASLPGHEALIDACITNGSTVESTMAAVIKAENDKRAGVLASLQSTTPDPVVAAVVPEQVPDEDKKDFDQMVTAHMEANKSTRGEAISAIAREFPGVHKAYIEKVNGGKK